MATPTLANSPLPLETDSRQQFADELIALWNLGEEIFVQYPVPAPKKGEN